MARIPVLILSGFLGSGKTTLLLRLIQEAQDKGLQYGILMNELGKQDLDGALLESEAPGVSLAKLFDGCICCDKKTEVAGSLLTLLDRRPDVLFIELTGVANPEEIADTLTEPKLLARTKLHSIVTVLDAENVLDYNSIFASDRDLVRTVRRQMEVADVILLNKTDLVSDSIRDKVFKVVRKYNESASVIPTRFADPQGVDLLEGLTPIEDRAAAAIGRPSLHAKPRPATAVRTASVTRTSQTAVQASNEGHNHHHRSYSRLQTLTLQVAPPDHGLDKKRIESFIKSIKGQLLRAKGYLPTSGGGLELYQYAGKRGSWTRAAEAYNGPAYLVLIGLELNTDMIHSEWDRLLQ